jgi:tRNA nucleotidyltransferase/poly(A) polymerase
MNLAHLLTEKIYSNIGKVADAHGFKAFLIGGFVRDLLLNRLGELKDIDIVVEGSGIEFANFLAKDLNTSEVKHFKNFGTAMLKYQNLEIEIVGARKESYNRNSRKPIVEDGTLADDQKRRDFTINALSIALNQENFGELHDPFHGIEDLKNKIIRTPLEPETTYSDDPLRMLRAIRFACQLDFTIHPVSLQAIKEQKNRLEIISVERISDELLKILASKKPSIGFRLLFETELLHYILPELTSLQGVEEKGNQAHKDNFYHTIQVVDQLAEKSDNIWLRFAALLHDVGKAPAKKYIEGTGWTFHNHEFIGSKMVPKIFKRLRLPLDAKMKYVQKIIRLSGRPATLTYDVSDSAVRRLLLETGDDIDDLMTLCESDITSKNKNKVERFLAGFKAVRQKLKDIEEQDHLRNFQPPITGDIIISTFNIEPGREIGIIKEQIKEAILEGKIANNYEEAYDLMLEKGEELGLTPHK